MHRIGYSTAESSNPINMTASDHAMMERKCVWEAIHQLVQPQDKDISKKHWHAMMDQVDLPIQILLCPYRTLCWPFLGKQLLSVVRIVIIASIMAWATVMIRWDTYICNGGLSATLQIVV